MDRLTKTDHGEIKIHNEVVSNIASIAALEVKGVVRVQSDFVSSITSIFAKRPAGKAVRVEQIGENEIKLIVPIVVEYAANIPEIAIQVQDAIKRQVEHMTGLVIVDITVNVQGVEQIKNGGLK